MISAFAKAGQVLEDASYVERALKAIEFVQMKLYEIDLSASAVSGQLLRSCYVDSSTAEIVHRLDLLYVLAIGCYIDALHLCMWVICWMRHFLRIFT